MVKLKTIMKSKKAPSVQTRTDGVFLASFEKITRNYGFIFWKYSNSN